MLVKPSRERVDITLRPELAIGEDVRVGALPGKGDPVGESSGDGGKYSRRERVGGERVRRRVRKVGEVGLKSSKLGSDKGPSALEVMDQRKVLVKE